MNTLSSSKERPINCMPNGSPWEFSPIGKLSAGRPANEIETVKISFNHMVIGFCCMDLSPMAKAAVGVVGVKITSHLLNASIKSWRIRRRTFCALR